MPESYVYILANHSKTLYTGVTNDLKRRIVEHKAKNIPGFTKKYRITKLIFAERFNSIRDAIDREKQIKGWTRQKKVKLIDSVNPRWSDLSID